MKSDIIDQLTYKQQIDVPEYTVEEIDWMLDHIGHPDKEIRDSLIYETFARGLISGIFTEGQHAHIVNQSVERDLIHDRLPEALPATLTRSFTALLNCLIVATDGDAESRYYESLADTERRYFFDSAQDYLAREIDYTGYNDEYGWVHGFAHGADYLAAVVTHPKFDHQAMPQVWEFVIRLLRSLPVGFSAGEERRLAEPFFEAVCAGVLAPADLAAWIRATELTAEGKTAHAIDFERVRCFDNFLASIYFHLETSCGLSDELRGALLERLRNYY